MHADQTELDAIRTLIETADLAAEAKQTALWWLGQLPGLYADFLNGYDSRHGVAIARLTQGLLMRLAEKGAGEDAGRVADALVIQLAGMHQRLGLPALDLRRKKVA